MIVESIGLYAGAVCSIDVINFTRAFLGFVI
jgi:hypothetical protein